MGFQVCLLVGNRFCSHQKVCSRLYSCFQSGSWTGFLKARILPGFLRQTRPLPCVSFKSGQTYRMSHHEGSMKESCDAVKKKTQEFGYLKNITKGDSPVLYIIVVAFLLLLGIGGVSVNEYFQEGNLQPLIDWIESFGPLASAVYGTIYFLLEVLCLPAFPLTVAAGYLFGFWKGLVTVSIAGTCASGVSFILSRYTLRSFVQDISKKYERFQTVDRAVSRQGFKIVFLLRLSPILPFAISNYLYGVTSIPFGPYILASWLGMLPGTALYVYGGYVGRSVTLSMDKGIEFHSEWLQQPWITGMGILVFLGVVSQLSRLATEVLNKEEEEEEQKILTDKTTHQENK